MIKKKNYLNRFMSVVAAVLFCCVMTTNAMAAFNFVVYGDSRSNAGVHNTICSRISSENPDLILHVGDLWGGYSSSTWKKHFTSRSNLNTLLNNNKILVAIGNHESESAVKNFSPAIVRNNRTNYSFIEGNVFFVCLGMDPSAAYLETELQKPEAQSADFRVIFHHYPIYSSGEHGANGDAAIESICDKYNVTFSFAGHDHDYERSKTIYDSDVTFSGSDVPAAVRGTTYVVTGGGGAPLRSVSPGWWTAKAIKKYHYCVLTAYSDRLEMTVKDQNGNVIDQFVRRTTTQATSETSIITLTAVNGKFVSADNGGNVLIANQTTVGDYEKFEIVDAGNGEVGLKCLGNGLFVCAEDKGNKSLVANRVHIGSWEKFTMIKSGGQIGFVASINGKYVCAEDKGDSPLVANRDQLGSWETFEYSSENTKNGLNATYYNNMDLTDPVINRVDSTVNFNWGKSSPDASIGSDTFSVEWSGAVKANQSGLYTFYTVSDDGVRLWVDEEQLINNWTNHAPVEDAGDIYLEGGESYPIKLEYYENGGGAKIQLLWSNANQAKQIIPEANLFNDGPGNGDNIAKGKPATQSSMAYGGAASRAVDGNTSGIWSEGSVTHTGMDAGAWWKVDLGGAYEVTDVTLWNRTDCCSERLSNFRVEYLGENGDVIATQNHPGTAGETTDIQLSARGVYSVRVKQNGTRILSLAEVQVFGKKGNSGPIGNLTGVTLLDDDKSGSDPDVNGNGENLLMVQIRGAGLWYNVGCKGKKLVITNEEETWKEEGRELTNLDNGLKIWAPEMDEGPCNCQSSPNRLHGETQDVMKSLSRYSGGRIFPDTAHGTCFSLDEETLEFNSIKTETGACDYFRFIRLD